MLVAALMMIAVPAAPPPSWSDKPPHKAAVMTNLGEIFTEANYPFWGHKNADEGRVRFRVSIDPTGRPIECEIVEAAEAESLNQPTCDLIMAQARFTPATDRRGRAIASVYSRVVRWQLENRDPWPVSDEYARVVIGFDPGGAQTCRIEGSPRAELDPRSCVAIPATPMVKGMMTLARFTQEAAGRAKWELVIEESSFADQDAAALVGRRPGEQVLQRSASRVTINPAGAVIKCETVESGGVAESNLKQSCERAALVVFEAGDGDRLLSLVSVIYVRTKPAA